jgi:hypothetical protein
MLQLIAGWILGSPRGLPITVSTSIASHPSHTYHSLPCKLSMAVETFRNTAGRKPPRASHTDYCHRRFAPASQPSSAALCIAGTQLKNVSPTPATIPNQAYVQLW